MKRLFYFILFISASGLRSPASGQTLTSYYELKLRSATTDKLVPGKNVDLYAAGTANKIYDLTESTTTPGVYYHNTVANGMYDIYVNTSLWKSNIWIGANKVTLISDVFTFGPDSMNFDSGVVTALRYFGDGSNLTGISGAGGVSNAGDTNIGADTDDNGTGQIFFNTRTVQRGTVANDGTLIWGEDTTDVAGSSVVVGGTLAVTSDDDSANVISLSAIDGQYTALTSGRTANKAFVPMTFWVKAKEAVRLDTTKAVLVGLLTTDTTPGRGDVVARGFNAVSDSVDASTIGFLPNIFGANYILSYHSGGGADLPIALSVGLSGATYILANGNLGINTTSIGTSGANVVSVKVGTAPSTSPTDVIQYGAEDVNSSAEMYVRDEAGNKVYLSDLTNRRCIAFDAMALYPHASVGPDLSVFNGQVELYEFAVGDTGYARASLVNYSSIDSIWVEAQSTSPAGDSAEVTVYWRGVQSGDVETAAFAGSATAEMDMGSTANGIIRFRFTSSLNTGLAANDDVTWAVVRTAATANEMVETLNIRRMVVWYH